MVIDGGIHSISRETSNKYNGTFDVAVASEICSIGMFRCLGCIMIDFHIMSYRCVARWIQVDIEVFFPVVHGLFPYFHTNVNVISTLLWLFKDMEINPSSRNTVTKLQVVPPIARLHL